VSLENLALEKIISLANEMEYNRPQVRAIRALSDFQAEVTYEWKDQTEVCEINLLDTDTEESLARNIRISIDKTAGIVDVQDVR
jgi:hypothetical protein